LLTLIPDSWGQVQAAEVFNVTRNLIKSSRKQFAEAGRILPPIKTKQGRKLNADTKKLVETFYKREDISRCCPGLKDTVSVKDLTTGKREHRRKHYLLANLRELYATFKEQYPETKVGLSSFLSLRPPECFSLTSKGYHNVCVCIHHENVKLLYIAFGQSSMKKYLDQFLCDEPTKNCYYRRCEQCKLKKQDVTQALKEIIDGIGKPIVRFKRWATTDGTQFTKIEMESVEFCSFVTEESEKLLKHHYLSVAQHKKFKRTREVLEPGQLIIWGDFSENYTSVTQNAIQSDYFNNKQITLHPFTIYYNKDGEVTPLSYCIISNCTIHDTNTFYAFQSALMKDLKVHLEALGVNNTKYIYYFSDGCAGQYKNRKNFVNLYHHKADFGIEAEWNFFATAHGKGPPDAIGGNSKRLMKVESRYMNSFLLRQLHLTAQLLHPYPCSHQESVLLPLSSGL
jgi:hypothetical protein